MTNSDCRASAVMISNCTASRSVGRRYYSMVEVYRTNRPAVPVDVMIVGSMGAVNLHWHESNRVVASRMYPMANYYCRTSSTELGTGCFDDLVFGAVHHTSKRLHIVAVWWPDERKKLFNYFPVNKTKLFANRIFQHFTRRHALRLTFHTMQRRRGMYCTNARAPTFPSTSIERKCTRGEQMFDTPSQSQSLAAPANAQSTHRSIVRINSVSFFTAYSPASDYDLLLCNRIRRMTTSTARQTQNYSITWR